MNLRRLMGIEEHGLGLSLVNRTGRRRLGVILLVVVSAMTMGGLYLFSLRPHPTALVVYWGVVLLLLFFVIYLAVLDVLFTRHHYAVRRRDIFRSTFGELMMKELDRTSKERPNPGDESPG